MLSKMLSIYLILGCMCAIKVVSIIIKRKEVSLLIREYGLWAEVIYVITWVLLYPVWFIMVYIDMNRRK